MGIRARSASEMCEFIIYVENLLHVSATHCGHLQCSLQTPQHHHAWMVLRAHDTWTLVIKLHLTKLINY